ncbi:MAG: hypothetical protein RL757_1692 [Bacteroidota bacterium]|jgi:3-phosphoshikimate 1-carboxyvinyltransferase
MIFEINKPNRDIVGEITLDGSKSISNRLLIIQALCDTHFEIQNCSTSKDSTTLQRLLADFKNQPNGTFDAGAAGTTFRFLTAFFAFQQGEQTLTGSERMKQRPIGKLVDALRNLGCRIEYLEKEGFPPLKIGAPSSDTGGGHLTVEASVSSQYITALLLVAPTLPQGLTLELTGEIVSRPYIDMTLSLMAHFGIAHTWAGNTISIAPQRYVAQNMRVEADWSAASYYYAMAAFAEKLDLTLNGVFENSLQGDAVVAEMGDFFGIETKYTGGGIHLKKKDNLSLDETLFFEYNFLKCPDIAQTLAVVCAGVGAQGLLTGLETLFIKETDRVAALQNELGKIDVTFYKLPARFSAKTQKQYFGLEGKANIEGNPIFETYEDHRMAMSFAPLAMLGNIQIQEPNVVEKSYPNFWKDLKKLGFEINEVWK